MIQYSKVKSWVSVVRLQIFTVLDGIRLDEFCVVIHYDSDAKFSKHFDTVS